MNRVRLLGADAMSAPILFFYNLIDALGEH